MEVSKVTINYSFFSEVDLTYKSQTFEQHLIELMQLGHEFEQVIKHELSSQKGQIIDAIMEEIRKLENYSQKYCSASIHSMKNRANEYT